MMAVGQLNAGMHIYLSMCYYSVLYGITIIIRKLGALSLQAQQDELHWASEISRIDFALPL